MKVFKIYHTKFFFLLSLLFIVVSFALLGLGIYALVKIDERWLIYVLVIWGLYSCYSVYFLLSLTYFRFKKYEKMKGHEAKAKITHRIPTSTEFSSKALAEVSDEKGNKYYAMVGLYGSSFEKKHPDDSEVDVFVMDGVPSEVLLLESTDHKEEK